MAININFAGLKTTWNQDDQPLVSYMKKLIDAIYTQKRLRFQKAEITEEFLELANAGILFMDGNVLGGADYGIQPDALFLFAIIKGIPEGNEQLPANVNEANDFLVRFVNSFPRDRSLWGITDLLKRLADFLLSYLWEIDPDGVFADRKWLKHDLRPEIFNPLYAAYLGLIKDHPPATSDAFWDISIHLATEIEKLPGSDSYANELATTVGEFAVSHPDQANQLKEKAISTILSSHLAVVGVALLTGLHLADALSLDEILSYINSDKEKVGIQLFELIKPKTAEQRLSAVKAIAVWIHKNSVIPQLIPMALAKLMDAAPCTETATLEACKALYFQMMRREDQAFRQSILFSLGRFRTHLELSIELVSDFIELVQNPKEYANGLANYMMLRRSAVAFFSVIRSYQAKKPVVDFLNFDNAATLCRDGQEELFDEGLTKMLIDDVGTIRWAGHQILTGLLRHPANFALKYQINKLRWIDQYKYCISLFEGNFEPKLLIPLIVPLLSSENEIVKAALEAKLLEYVDNYNGLVIVIMESTIDLSVSSNQQLLEVLKERQKEGNERWQRKIAIKELHPFFNQGVLMRRYLNLHDKKSRQDTEQFMQKNSVIKQLAHQVSILRGGGWQPNDALAVQKLNRIAVSMPFPRRIFVHPEANDKEFKENFLRNWKEEYQQWE